MRNFLSKLCSIVSGSPLESTDSGGTAPAPVQRGFLVFQHTGEVIRAEQVLRRAGFKVKVMGPPPNLRTGCDMVIVFDIMTEPVARRVLEAEHLVPLQVVPVQDALLEPISLYQVKDFKDWAMVRAANMKITLEKASGVIVNVSGGGCPDVPYLAALLTGQSIVGAEEPRVKGQTLCAYALQHAFEEAKRLEQLDFSLDPPTPTNSIVAEEQSILRNDAIASPCATVTPFPKDWLICGTVPDPEFTLHETVWTVRGGQLHADACGSLPIQRGTPALIAATGLVCASLGIDPPRALLVGDCGTGDGSRKLYQHLAATLRKAATPPDGITFHYLFPDLDGHNTVLMALEDLPRRPLLVADAGFMYVAKMSGYADLYDLFTPDVGEMAFLADEHAPHPFYTRGFLLATENDVPELVRRATEHGNCARHLLVKGARDRVVVSGTVCSVISEPQVPAMEAMGGTGDLITGTVTALLMAGYSMLDAAAIAARTNRILGDLTNPTPATQVAQILPRLPDALQICLGSGCSLSEG